MAYKEHYHQGKDEAARYREQKHVGKTCKTFIYKKVCVLISIDHCIEYLREYLMCKPDLSLVTFHWINNTAQYEDPSARYPTNSDSGLHECANWNTLNAWAGDHVFDLYNTELLKKPEHGLKYENSPQ